MNQPPVASLLLAWCMCLVAPAWIDSFGFRGTDVNTPILDPIIAIWLVGSSSKLARTGWAKPVGLRQDDPTITDQLQ